MSRKPTVLAVDDTPANLLALEAVLERTFELRFASSGEEAIAMLQGSPDVAVILMDVQMPGMDGFEAAARIKKLPGCAEIPIVFITAVYREDPHVKRGYEAGGVDYFSKPFDPDLLRMKVAIYASFRERNAVLLEREQQLRETEKLLEASRMLSLVFESAPIGVLIADLDGRICQVNDEILRICKGTTVASAAAPGEALAWWSSGDATMQGLRSLLARALHAGEASEPERRLISCLDGTTKPILASASPLFDAYDRVVGAALVIKDMTHPRQIGQELETRAARLTSPSTAPEQGARSGPAT